MKIRVILMSMIFVAGVMHSSCSASKTCPAYSKAKTEQQKDTRS